MNKKLFQEFFTQKGFKVYGGGAFGIENSYPVTVNFIQNGLLNILLLTDIAEPKNAIKELKKDVGKKGRLSYANGILYLSLPVKKNNYSEHYKMVLLELTSLLLRKGYVPTKNCPLCQRADCDTLAAIPHYAPTHKNCLDQMLRDVQNKVEKNELGGNYFTGIIGAILGAIVGTIPSIFTVIVNDTIYAILFALIPLCIYQGYKLLAGKMNKIAIVITLILSVISVYLMQISLTVYWMVVDEGLPLRYMLSLLPEWLLDPSTWVFLTQESILYFIFVALGIYFAWTKISRTGASEIQDISKIHATAIPFNTVE